MRNVEEKIIGYLKNSDFLGGSACCGLKKRLSPRDSVTREKTQKRVYLHGNCIFTLSRKNHIKFSLQGWATITTKSRINALLSAFLPCSAVVCQRNYQLFFISYAGEFPIDSDKIYTVQNGKPKEVESI